MYSKIGFNNYQIAELDRGVRYGVDCSVFWHHHFDNFQMYQIIDGLYKGLDVSVYASPDYDAGQMREIRMGLESGIDYQSYAKPEIDEYDMFQIREMQETELSKVRYLGRIHIFEADSNRKRQKYKEFSALVNLDMTKYENYDSASLRAVLPLIYGGQEELALNYLNSAKPVSQIAYEVSKIPVSYTLPEGNPINEDILEDTYPNGYKFVKQHKYLDLDSNDLKVAFIVNQFGEISEYNIEILEAIMVAALCNYDLSYINREGFDLRFTRIVLDLVDLNLDYEFLFNEEYSFNQKLEIYRAAIAGLDVSLFSSEMTLGEMISLRKKLTSDTSNVKDDVVPEETEISVEFIDPEKLPNNEEFDIELEE